MKITFIAGTLGRGGAEKQLLCMLRALQGSGIRTGVLSLTRGEAYEREIRDLGVPVDWAGKFANRGLRLLEIVSRLRREGCDIVQSSHFYTNIYAGAAARALKVPGIGAIRSNLVSELSLHGVLGRYQVSLPDLLIANSDAAYRNALERGIPPEKIEVVRNAVDPGPGFRDRLLYPKTAVSLLFVGRLGPEKRADRFIGLAAELTRRMPSAPLRFRIAGDGTEREKLEGMAREAGLGPERMEFLGECAAMGDVYRTADILVSTSDYEGTPNAVLEAMAHGIPVIATNVGGVGSIVDEKRGILVEPGDGGALADAAARLILNCDIRHAMGQNGRRYILSNHSVDGLRRQLTGIYERLLRPARQSATA